MTVPFKSFLKAAGKAIVKYCGNVAGFGLFADGVVEVGCAVAEDIWGYLKKKSPEERRAEIEAVAQATVQEVVPQVAEIVAEVAAHESPEFQTTLSAYLAQIPAMVQKSLRRQSDPTGTTLSAQLVPRAPEDLLPFLPPKLPRFKQGDRFLDYELQQLLGVGGFGEVWKARHPVLDGFVALKFCADEKAKDQVLRHEAKVLTQVMRQGHHEGIVQLRNTYLNADPPCLEYEYVEGGDLAALIKKKKPKPDVAAQIILRLARIVGFAHTLNPPVVHRDLKPANILVQQTNDTRIELKVTDFGIGGIAAAHAIGESRRLAASRLAGAHTPLYASPQQIRGAPPDPRDDVYSLGIIWYQMLIGDPLAGRPGGRRWAGRASCN